LARSATTAGGADGAAEKAELSAAARAIALGAAATQRRVRGRDSACAVGGTTELEDSWPVTRRACARNVSDAGTRLQARRRRRAR
jgi:hypothetical protein